MCKRNVIFINFIVYIVPILFLFCFVVFAVYGPLTVVASPVAEHRLRTHGLSGHGSRAQPLRGMWDPPGPGHKPTSPASAGGLSTTVPPGKPSASLTSDSFTTLNTVGNVFYNIPVRLKFGPYRSTESNKI